MVCYFPLKNVLKVFLYSFVFLSRGLQELKGEENTVDQKEVISLTFNYRTEGPLLPLEKLNSLVI